MSAKTILVLARDLIRDPKRWTRGSAARDRLGFPVEPYSEIAVCWCADGAVRRISAVADDRIGVSEARYVLRLAGTQLFCEESLVVINDREGWPGGHEGVMRLFGRAIELADGAREWEGRA